MKGIEFVVKYQDVLKISKIERESGVGKTALYKSLRNKRFSRTIEDLINKWYKQKYQDGNN